MHQYIVLPLHLCSSNPKSTGSMISDTFIIHGGNVPVSQIGLLQRNVHVTLTTALVSLVSLV